MIEHTIRHTCIIGESWTIISFKTLPLRYITDMFANFVQHDKIQFISVSIELVDFKSIDIYLLLSLTCLLRTDYNLNRWFRVS